MTRYLIGRVAQALLVLWAAWTVAYFILYLLPGDALDIMLTSSGVEADTLSPQQLAQYRAEFGLDRGVFEQYFAMLFDALRGDFGVSASRQGESVGELLLARLPSTLALAGLAIVFSIAAGVG